MTRPEARLADRVKNQLGSLEPEVVGAGASSAVASRASSGQVRTHRCPTQQSSCIPNKGVTVSSLSIPNCPGQVCMKASFPLPLSLHSPPFFPHFLSKLSELTPGSPSRPKDLFLPLGLLPQTLLHTHLLLDLPSLRSPSPKVVALSGSSMQPRSSQSLESWPLLSNLRLRRVFTASEPHNGLS